MTVRERWRRAFQREETPESLAQNIDAELRAHLEIRVEQLMTEGMSEADARARAAQLLGDATSAASECERFDRRWLWRRFARHLVGSIAADVGYALRIFRTSPLFATLASLCLAVGITFTASTYVLVNATALHPLPFEDADEIVMIGRNVSRADWTWLWSSFNDYRNWEEEAQTLENVAVFDFRWYTITDLDNPMRLRASEVSHAFDEVVMVRANLGRTFTPADYAPGAERVVLLSHGIWQQAYGGDPDIVGRHITLNGEFSHRVVGVMPPKFTFPEFMDLWVPLLPETQADLLLNNSITFGRLRDGVTTETAQAEIGTIDGRVAASREEASERRDARVVPYGPFLFQALRTPLIVIFFLACLVLLLACSNLANLMLSRATGRARELSLRAVLGAGRGRLVQQLLVESLVFAAVGGVIGITLGRLGLHLLLANLPREVPGFMQFELNGSVLVSLAGIVLLSGIVFGLAPVLSVRRGSLGTPLRSDTVRMSGGKTHMLTRSSLVVFQIALATIILAVTGLVVRSYIESLNSRLGVDTDRLLGQFVQLPGWAYPERGQRISFFRDGIDRIHARPEVEMVSYISQAPAARTDWTVRISTSESASDNEQPFFRVRARIISPGYLETAGIPLLAGRDFTESDAVDGPRVALVNAALARILWDGDDPLGRQFFWLFRNEGPDPETATEIVGIVGDVRHGGPGVEAGPCFYIPFGRFNAPTNGWFVMRTSGDPKALASVVRQELQTLDPQLALEEPRTVAALASEKNWRTIFTTWIMTVIAGFAIVLALVGIVGVVAYTVTTRMREFGIRLALGADTGSILTQVLRRGAVMAGTGIAAGMVVTAVSMRFVAGVLVNTGAKDPVVYAVVLVFLAATTLLAAYLPARRIVGIDPVDVLREE